MQVKVLQGLNVKNPVTTIVAEMQAVKPDLLDFIKNLHPVFMKDYQIIEGKTLEVQTHLPNLWNNNKFLQAIEDFSTGTKSLEDSKKEILEVIKLLINSMSTIPILHAAHEMDYETIPFYIKDEICEASSTINRYYSIGIGKETAVTVSAASTGDSHLAQKTQKDKWLTNLFLENMELPLSPWALVESKEELPKLGQQVGYPLVLKPVGLTGGHGVIVGIQNEQELLKAYDDTIAYYNSMEREKADWQKKIIIQKMVKGADYRMLVVNGVLEIATNRIPAQVIGNGKDTIRKLIELENQNPARDVTLPTHTLKPIVIDEVLEKIVSEQGFTIDSVPEKDKAVQVRKVASMSQGGITKDVTEIVHPQIKFICESIARTIHANVLGIDILCQDISKPLTLENGSIIEMNTMPEAYLNSFPVIGNPYPDLGKKILLGIMDPDIRTTKIVIIGNSSQNIQPEQITNGYNGHLLNNTIYINGQEIHKVGSIRDGVVALKKNHLLDSITLHYQNAEDVIDNGFGFNSIDLLEITQNEQTKLANVIDTYKNQGLIKEVKIVQAFAQ